MIFLWARVRVLNDASDRAMLRNRSMNFKDFMEGLVRLSTAIALPFTADLEESGCANAGEFLTALAAAGQYEALLQERKQDWQLPPRQKIWQTLEHLIAFLIYIVQNNQVSEPAHQAQMPQAALKPQSTGSGGPVSVAAVLRPPMVSKTCGNRLAGAVDQLRQEMRCGGGGGEVDGCGGGSGGGAGGEGCISCGEGGGRASTPAHGTLGALCAGLEEITPERAFAFSKRRLDGKDLNRLPHLAETGRRVVQALRDVRMRAIKAFEAVAVFAQLLPEQIERLYENMGRATYQPGEAIFEQDDNGDTFYIVIEGSADVTRWEDDVEKTIASLGS